jgi:hypothetical protein
MAENCIASQRVLRVPELLATICSLLEPPERGKLAAISRVWFLASTPVIWKEATGIQHLLRLIPEVTLQKTGSDTLLFDVSRTSCFS